MALRILPRRLGAVLLAMQAALASAVCAPPGEGRLAVIIDDLGYSWERGKTIIQLPSPVTLAIIPHTPHATALAELAREHGKEVMVHMPMTSSQTAVTNQLMLSEHLTDAAFDTIIDEAVQSVPGAAGMNNHMGSALTTNREAMRRFMLQMQQRQLFFIDSRTSADTVAAEVAQETDVPNASRSVFLDNQRDPSLIRDHLSQAVELAQTTGYAIAIGHPYPETVEVLVEELPRLPSEITLTPASEITRCAGFQRLTSIP